MPQLIPAAVHPEGIFLAEIVPRDRRLVTSTDRNSQSSATLSDALSQLTERSPHPIVLNLLNVDWIDSGACAVLIRFWRELRSKGRPLVLIVSETVRETFVITGLIRLIPCHSTLEDATQAARQAAPTPDTPKGS